MGDKAKKEKIARAAEAEREETAAWKSWIEE